jgi:hypothetical protein
LNPEVETTPFLDLILLATHPALYFSTPTENTVSTITLTALDQIWIWITTSAGDHQRRKTVPGCTEETKRDIKVLLATQCPRVLLYELLLKNLLAGEADS